jgi:hypothetical protein
MAGQASTVGSKIMLDAASGRATQTSRTTYLALLTAAPTDASTLSTMTEVSTAGYSRQAVTWSDPGSTETTSNSNTITFGPFSADPPNVTHCALVSAASGTSGDLIWWWSLDTARDGASGDSISVAASALSMSAE